MEFLAETYSMDQRAACMEQSAFVLLFNGEL